MAILAILSSAAVFFQEERMAMGGSNSKGWTEGRKDRRILREIEGSQGRLPRTLVGIFGSADAEGALERQRYRRLLEGVWGRDERVCSLSDFLEQQHQSQAPPPEGPHPSSCLLVYTFVVGAATDSEAPMELLEDHAFDFEFERPLVLDQIDGRSANDEIHRKDVTRLNIRENTDQGKTQTFFYYVSKTLGAGRPSQQLSQQPHEEPQQPLVDYCLKVRASDTLLSIESFLENFVSTGDLPPPPYAKGILGGVIRDKAYDAAAAATPPPAAAAADQNKEKEDEEAYLPRLESFWGNEFEGVHLYVHGRLYLLSMDLVDWVLEENPRSKTRIAPGGYLEGREDHDISGMVFHSPTPVHMLIIADSQRFWEYPLITPSDWETALLRQEKRRPTNPLLPNRDS